MAITAATRRSRLPWPSLQSAAFVTAARDQTPGLDPARAHAEIADVEAVHRRAEAAAVMAATRQPKPNRKPGLSPKPLVAVQEHTATAQGGAGATEETALALAAELDQVRRSADRQAAASQADAGR